MPIELHRNGSVGRKYLYDIVSIKENTGLALDPNQKAKGRRNAATQSDVSAVEQSGNSDTSTTKDNIPAEGGDVNRKFSLKGMDSVYMEAVERGDTGAAQKGKYPKALKTKEKPGKRCVSSVFFLAQWEGFEPSCRF